MDDLSLEQIDRYFFVYKPPERLKDHGRERLRSELLAFINEQLLDEWRKTPRILREVLQTLGRGDLSTKVHELVGKSHNSYNMHGMVACNCNTYAMQPAASVGVSMARYTHINTMLSLFVESCPATTVCQETAPGAGGLSPQQESAVTVGRQHPPVQETVQQSAQTPLRSAQDELDESDRDCTDKDRSSTEGEAQREVQPQALPNHSTVQSSRYNVTRKSLKQRGGERPLENIQEETSPLLDGDMKRSTGKEGSLKRTASTASTVSQYSSRSSGYYSNPRTSILRLSTADSFTENEDCDLQEEEDGASKFGSLKQTHRDSVEDEGVVTDVHHSSNFRAESPESSGSDSSSPPSSPSKSDQTTKMLAAEEEQHDLQPVLRERCHQMTGTPIRKRRQLPKQSDALYDDFLPEDGEMRRRSSSLPTTTRARCVIAQNAPTMMHMHGVASPHSQSHSSSTSLESETTYGSPSEQSSVNGSQLSLASAASGKWLICLTLLPDSLHILVAIYP